MKEQRPKQPFHAATAIPPDSKRRAVLYVEDNPLNRKIMKIRLEREYRILLAANDREACDLMRAFGHEVSCILMDIELQGSQLNGLELACLFRGHPLEGVLPDYAHELPHSMVPLFFITAYGEKYPLASLFAVGDRVLYKPVDFHQLTVELAASVSNPGK